MKKIVSSLLVAAAGTLSSGAMAQVYVAGDIGRGGYCSGFFNSCLDTTALKLTGGYQLGHGFSAELGYIDFGDDGVFKNTAGTLGAAYELPLSPSWNGVARLGVARVESKFRDVVGGPSASATTTELYYGLGVNYAINKNVKLEAAVDWTHAGDDGANRVARAITVGARYEF